MLEKSNLFSILFATLFAIFFAISFSFNLLIIWFSWMRTSKLQASMNSLFSSINISSKNQSTTRFTCTRCWLRIFCKLCLSKELNNLININKAVTALYSCVELTHSWKAKQWQRDHQRIEARIYTEWQQRLCIHAATHIQHIHIYCEDTIQLLRTYKQTWCSKSIDFSHFQADLHAAQSHTKQ